MLRINALGSFAVTGDEGPLAGAVTQPRRAAVLALIARARDRGIAREKILNYLWPDSDEEHGRRVLTRALSALRAELGAEDAFLGQSELRLNPAVVTSDVVEFDVAIAEGDLDRAATLYRGPFLDGFRLPGAHEFERWVEAERAALAHEYEVAIERLARLADSRGDHASAVRWWRRTSCSRRPGSWPAARARETVPPRTGRLWRAPGGAAIRHSPSGPAPRRRDLRR